MVWVAVREDAGGPFSSGAVDGGREGKGKGSGEVAHWGGEDEVGSWRSSFQSWRCFYYQPIFKTKKSLSVISFRFVSFRPGT